MHSTFVSSGFGEKPFSSPMSPLREFQATELAAVTGARSSGGVIIVSLPTLVLSVEENKRVGLGMVMRADVLKEQLSNCQKEQNSNKFRTPK
ncbi:hypothetical protein BaRGS_00038460 [Batillaria attramentaria]|uniref:Uncharacterized protein n=1 Tax=Batillaria attramentaria TaxID=370345 RepID=A0ABD0J635_9CAEN